MKEGNAFAITSLVIGIISFVLSCCYCGFLGIIGFIFGIIALNKKQSKAMSIAGIVLSLIGFLVSLFTLAVFLFSDSESQEDGTITTEISTELTTESTTELTTDVANTEMSKEDFYMQAEYVTYDDIYRNPEKYKDVPIKIIVDITEYDTEFLGLIDVYYAEMEGKPICLVDERDSKEPTISKGDNVIIYGKGSGLATLTETQKNILGIKVDSEKAQIPNVSIKYAELQ